MVESPIQICVAARMLLDAYDVALSARGAALELLLTTPDSERAQLVEIRVVDIETHWDLVQARGRYWKHVQMHRCASHQSEPFQQIVVRQTAGRDASRTE